MEVRSATATDRGLIWALSGIPHIGATGDPSFPELASRDTPPREFPDLANVPDSFLSAGGNFFVVEEDGRLVGMGGYKRTGDDEAQVFRVRIHSAMRRDGDVVRVARNISLSTGPPRQVCRVSRRTRGRMPGSFAWKG